MHPNSCVFDWATRERGGPFTELRVDSICKPSVLHEDGSRLRRSDLRSKRGEIGPEHAACNNGPGGIGVEAPGPAVSGGAVETLDEDQEPGASGDDEGYGCV